MSVRDDLRDMLEGVPDERLDDVRTYLEHLREADAAWIAWQERYGGAGSDERARCRGRGRRRSTTVHPARDCRGLAALMGHRPSVAAAT
jgi:hypothetical protein